jgi:hypothetical protein
LTLYETTEPIKRKAEPRRLNIAAAQRWLIATDSKCISLHPYRTTEGAANIRYN